MQILLNFYLEILFCFTWYECNHWVWTHGGDCVCVIRANWFLIYATDRVAVAAENHWLQTGCRIVYGCNSVKLFQATTATNKQTCSSRFIYGQSIAKHLLPLFDNKWFNKLAESQNGSFLSSLCFVWFNWALSFPTIKQVAYSRLNLDGSSIVPNESLRQIKLIWSWAKKVIRATRQRHTNPHTGHESGFLAIKDRQTLILLLNLSKHNTGTHC